MSPSMLPQFDLAPLHSARFAEVSLGALVCNQVPLALELSNAAVLCLKECAKEHIYPGCLSKLTQLGSQVGNEALLAAQR